MHSTVFVNNQSTNHPLLGVGISFYFLLNTLGTVYYLLDVHNETGIIVMCLTIIIINVLGLFNHM